MGHEIAPSMNKYRYQFRIEKINLREKNFKDDSDKEFLRDKELMGSINKLIGLPISILLEDSKEFPNEGTWFAQCLAEDKASEIIATLIGTTFGGSQKHMPNYEDADIKGRFVRCRLESIEQV